MINIPTRGQTVAVAVVREMSNPRGKLTNANIGSHVAAAAGTVVETMSRPEIGNEREKRNEKGSEKERPVGRRWEWNAKRRTWTSRPAIPRPPQNL